MKLQLFYLVVGIVVLLSGCSKQNDCFGPNLEQTDNNNPQIIGSESQLEVAKIIDGVPVLQLSFEQLAATFLPVHNEEILSVNIEEISDVYYLVGISATQSAYRALQLQASSGSLFATLYVKSCKGASCSSCRLQNDVDCSCRLSGGSCNYSDSYSAYQ